MISFRFHVVSITAVFLAIAIGVFVGSTYVDGFVVNRLESQIVTVRKNVADVRDENGRLGDDLKKVQDYVELSSQYAVTDRLTDVPVLALAERGVDDAAVKQSVVLARQSGAVVPGIVWIEPRWALQGQDDAVALAAIVDGSPSDAPEELWAAAWELVVDEVSSTGRTGDEVLLQLEEAGFLTVDPLDDPTVAVADLTGSDARVLLLTGAHADEKVAPVGPVVVDASVAGGLVTVVADVYVVDPDAPGRGTALVESLDEGALESIVVVDAADLEAGRVAAVLSVASAGDGAVGFHYGYGDGADAVLPAWTPP